MAGDRRKDPEKGNVRMEIADGIGVRGGGSWPRIKGMGGSKICGAWGGKE